jgi:hypothetical protein
MFTKLMTEALNNMFDSTTLNASSSERYSSLSNLTTGRTPLITFVECFLQDKMEISEETSAPLHEADRCSSEVVTDCWDNVINFESNSFDSGVVDGRADAIESGEMLENGIQSGFLKGTTRFFLGVSIGEDFLLDLSLVKGNFGRAF